MNIVIDCTLKVVFVSYSTINSSLAVKNRIDFYQSMFHIFCIGESGCILEGWSNATTRATHKRETINDVISHAMTSVPLSTAELVIIHQFDCNLFGSLNRLPILLDTSILADSMIVHKEEKNRSDHSLYTY